jgi:hypothetical protein
VYGDREQKKGWNTLDVSSHPSYPDLQQAYAAGYLEGALTQPVIWLAFKTFWFTSRSS